MPTAEQHLSLRPQNGRWSSIPVASQQFISSSPAHHRSRAHTPTARPRARLITKKPNSPDRGRQPPNHSPPTRTAPTSSRPQAALRPFCCAVLRASSTSRCARDITRAVSLHQTSQLPQPHTFRSHRVCTFRSSTNHPCHRAHLAALPHVPACRGSSSCPPTCASYMALSSSSCTLGWRKPP